MLSARISQTRPLLHNFTRQLWSRTNNNRLKVVSICSESIPKYVPPSVHPTQVRLAVRLAVRPYSDSGSPASWSDPSSAAASTGKKSSRKQSGSFNDLKRVDSLNDDAKLRMFEEVSFSIQNHSKNPLPYTLKNTYTKRARRVLDLLLRPLKEAQRPSPPPFDSPFLKDNSLSPHFPFAIRQVCTERRDLGMVSNLPLAYELLKRTNGALVAPLKEKDKGILLRAHNEMLAGCLKAVAGKQRQFRRGGGGAASFGLKLAEELYENFPFHLTSMDNVTHNTLSGVYLKMGLPKMAQRTFSNLTEFDSHGYRTGLQISKDLVDLEAAEGIWQEFEREYRNEACLFIGLSQIIETVRATYLGLDNPTDAQRDELYSKVLHYYDLGLELSATCPSSTVHSDFSMVLNSRILAATHFGMLDDLRALKSELEERKIENISPYIALLQGIRVQIHRQDVKVLKGLELATSTTSLLTEMMNRDKEGGEENNKRSNQWWLLTNSKNAFTWLTNIFVDVLSPQIDTFGRVRRSSLHNPFETRGSGNGSGSGSESEGKLFTDMPFDITLSEVKDDDESRRIVCQMALEEYDKIKEAGVRPSKAAFVNIVKVLGHAQLFEVAFELLTEETKRDIERGLESTRKYGLHKERMFTTSLGAWNELILSFATGGAGGSLQLSDVFDSMLKLGVRPNYNTFNLMAHVYKCKREGGESFKLLDYLIRSDGSDGLGGQGRGGGGLRRGGAEEGG